MAFPRWTPTERLFFLNQRIKSKWCGNLLQTRANAFLGWLVFADVWRLKRTPEANKAPYQVNRADQEPKWIDSAPRIKAFFLPGHGEALLGYSVTHRTAGHFWVTHSRIYCRGNLRLHYITKGVSYVCEDTEVSARVPNNTMPPPSVRSG